MFNENLQLMDTYGSVENLVTDQKEYEFIPFFSNSKLKIEVIFSILYKYLKNNFYADIEYDLNVNRKTIRKYGEIVRENIYNFIFENNERICGLDERGLSKIVEIDESLFFKRKYNR
ncbi:hypothetical protein DMUE_6097 [Dictyocoela muelleri]|nr:hypothetical protein DMUE_6097 [Dictyocoela muelleri]